MPSDDILRRRRCPDCGSPNVRKKNPDSIQQHPHRRPGDFACMSCRASFDEPDIADEPAPRRAANTGIAAALEEMDPDDLGGGGDRGE
ncbi:MAG: hypothetical protein ABEI57_05700 [Halapricum sp.]